MAMTSGMRGAPDPILLHCAIGLIGLIELCLRGGEHLSRPPIFSLAPSGSMGQRYMHRARMFRAAAMRLADYVNGEPNWPKYALLTHAIELALKAFVDHSGKSGGQRPSNHDLTAWYQLALQCGLPDEPNVAQHINVLNELHQTHYTRYPQEQAPPVPGADNIADSTVDHLLDIFTRSINVR
jgi:hypothetical protein